MYPCDEVWLPPLLLSFSSIQNSMHACCLLTEMLTYNIDVQAEKERMDIYHAMFLCAQRKQLHRAPLAEPRDSAEPCRVLDLGTGTGIWAIDMAE